MEPDKDRLERVRRALDSAQVDALLCRLAENVLFLTGYWPLNGFAFALLPRDGDLTLVVPEGELEHTGRGWVSDVRSFGWGQVKDGNPFDSMARLIADVGRDYRLGSATIGLEESFEFISPAYMAGEVSAPTRLSRDLVERALPEVRVMDASPLLTELRRRKTRRELERLKISNEIACMGLAAFKEACQPGVRETEVAAAVEAAIYSKGVGYKGVHGARGWAFVMSGDRTATSHRPYLDSTTRTLTEGDLVLIELGTVADGLWSDLTRTVTVGEPSARQREIWQTVRDAQQAALKALKPGVADREVDRAARSLIEERGFGPYFVHHTGHGVGFRYHEPAPWLHPTSDDTVEEGMVTSVEPGIYIPGFGGIRVEDDVAVTDDGAQVLSEFNRELD